MTDTPTSEQIHGFAADPASFQAAQRLANTRTWVSLGRDERAAWGECQGSASKPYRTQIDLAAPTLVARCSCPSRKTPCKHAIGLLLLLADAPHAFAEQTQPAWVSEWLKSRAPAASEPTPAKTNTASSARRASAREARVGAGLTDARRWLDDLVRHGLAAAQQQPISFWENFAARMVDSQAPGVARQIRELPGIIASGRDWQGRLLERLARLHMLLEGYARLESLPPETQADIRTAIGWTYSREELLAEEGTRDTWLVLGRSVQEEDQMRTQRVWLYGMAQRRFALILDFAPAHMPLDRSLSPGTAIDAELVFYPSAAPLRALVKQQHTSPATITSFPDFSVEAALATCSDMIARQPWIERMPLLLSEVIPQRNGEQWHVRDSHGYMLPIASRFRHGWRLLAVSGGRPIGMFGEWNGVECVPLCAWAEGAFILVSDD